MKKLVAATLAAVLVVALLAIPALGASSKTVKVADNTFAPRTLIVKRGTTIKFVWTGKVPHNVTVQRGPAKFRSSTRVKGTFSKKLTRSGTYRILCTIHAPSMKMVIKVR